MRALLGEILGGVNPKQVGLGAQLGTIDTIDTQGSLQTTGRSLDLAISGDGYFVLIDSAGENPTYTRSGNFYLDSQGMIVNADGKCFTRRWWGLLQFQQKQKVLVLVVMVLFLM